MVEWLDSEKNSHLISTLHTHTDTQTRALFGWMVKKNQTSFPLSTPTLTLKPAPSSVKWLNMVKGATCVSQTGNPQPTTANRQPTTWEIKEPETFPLCLTLFVITL
jgi:hypothetical protein